MEFNPTDLIVAVALALSAFLAFFRGFVRELLALATWVGAAIAALYAFKPLKGFVEQLISPSWLASAVTGVGVFLLAFIVLTVFTRPIVSRVKDSAFSGLDRFFGLAFGLVRGAFLLCLAYLAFSLIVPRDDYPDWLKGARTLPFLDAGAKLIRGLAPRDSVPEPAKSAKDAAPGTGKGYKPEELKDLDRLIRQTTE
jgi:membrane protein required for colicin V production